MDNLISFAPVNYDFSVEAAFFPEVLADSGCAGASFEGSDEDHVAGASCSERDRLILEHMKTVRMVARRIHERLPQHVAMEDLISAGTIGLIDAATKFDSTKKVQFRSYAEFRIKGAILDSLRVLDWGSRDLRKKGRAIQDAIQSLTQSLGRVPTEQETCHKLGMKLPEFQLLLGDLKGLEVGSLNVVRGEESEEQELAYIPGSPEEDPLFRCLQGEMKQGLADAIDDLPERERMVLTLYYYEELTMKEIGEVLGVVESRVSQIRSSAVLHLRASMAAFGKSKNQVVGAKRPGKRVA